MIFDYTDAHTLALVDAVDPDHAHQAWLSAQRAFQSEGFDAAEKALVDSLPAGGTADTEHKAIRYFCTNALGAGKHDRIQVTSISAADVLELLPVGAFVDGEETWDGAA